MPNRRELAGLPLYPELRRVTLATLRGIQRPAGRRPIFDHVANALNLTVEQRSVMCANGSMPEYMDRIGWALSDLKAAGAVDNVAHASWDLTEVGASISEEEVERRVAERAAQYRRNRAGVDSQVEDADDETVESDWLSELLERLRSISPAGFEHLSGALLEAAGFHDVSVTQKTGDGGIDVLAVYRPQGLIAFRTTVQCKRWTGGVGPDRVQAFQGASMGKADRGIIITTGYFTDAAKAQAQAPGAFPVDLVDGAALCELLREHSLGVRTTQRVVEDITVDDAYFAQFEDSP